MTSHLKTWTQEQILDTGRITVKQSFLIGGDGWRPKGESGWRLNSEGGERWCHDLCFDSCFVSSFPVLFWNINFPLVSGTLPFLLCQVSDCLPWFPKCFHLFPSAPRAQIVYVSLVLCQCVASCHEPHTSVFIHSNPQPQIPWACSEAILLQSVSFVFDNLFFRPRLNHGKFHSLFCSSLLEWFWFVTLS